MYIHSLSLIEKKNPESMNTFCWFSVKTRCQPQTQSWGEKKRNFQQRNVEKKKSPFVSDFTWTSFCRVEDDRKKKTCSIFEWRRTITLLSHTHDHVPVVFPLPWIRYEHASDGLEGRPALDPALLLLCLNYSFPAPKQLRCEKANLRDLNKNWLHH